MRIVHLSILLIYISIVIHIQRTDEKLLLSWRTDTKLWLRCIHQLSNEI